MAELEKEGLNQTMHENRDEDEPHYTDDSKTSKIQDDASFEKKLIEEVRRYNNLYNTSLKDYKDFTITSNSWKEIAQTLRVEEQVCRTKWKKLRDRYVRLRRKIKGKSGGAASGIQTQILTTLSWLSGFIKHKETKSDYPQEEEMDTSEDLQDDNLIEREPFHYSNNELQDGHLAIRRNVILERTKFNQRQQEAGETADDFISALHCLSEHCGYGALLSEKIRNRLVMGLRDKRLSEQLQMDPEITLDEAVTRIRQKQQDLPENTFKATSNAANIEGVLSHSKQQCPANSQCQSEKNKNTERPQQPQTTQENEEDPLDTDDFIEDFRPGGEKPHYCAYCGQNFQKVRDLIRHHQTHTGVKEMFCPDCGKGFTRSDNLKRHQRTHKKGGDCLYCDKSFSEPGELKIHMEVHSQERPYLCPNCGKQFKQLWVLKNHQLKHTEKISPQERHHYCSDCGKSFTRRHSLRRHQQETHTDEKPYHCSNCNKSFAGRERLKKHQLTHKEKKHKHYRCSRCDKRFPDMAKLRSHLPVHTGDLALHCSDCGKCFLNKAKFERHQRTHTGSVLYLCTDCGEGFTNMQQLERHQRMHTGEKPYHCTDCGKSFALEKTFKCHKQAHKFKLSGERAAYPCSECGNTFSRSCDVMTHVRRVHNKERPFQCSCCGKRFFQKNSLTIHMRSHTGEKPYHCSDCGQSFSQINDRKRHQKRQHSGGETTSILQSEKKCQGDTQ